MRIKQTLVIKCGTTSIEVGSMTFNDTDAATPQRMTMAKQIVKSALNAVAPMFAMPDRANITVSVKSGGA